MTAGAGKFTIQNLSEYHVRIVNASNTLLGFANSFGTVNIDLANAATSAGTWTLNNGLRLGVSAERPNQFTTEGFALINGVPNPPIELDSDRVFFLYRNSSDQIYGQIFSQSTNTWGAQTLLRSATTVGQKCGAVKIDANKLIVASCSNTNFEAVVLSLSGTTITVNTATASTLSQAVSIAYAFKAVPSGGFVYVYRNTSSAAFVVPMSVSGNTVTIGTVATEFSTVSGITGLFVQTAADKVILYAPNDSTGTGGFIAYSLSGSTLTAGTRVSVGNSTTTASKFVKLTDTTFFYDSYTTAVTHVGVISLTGTSVTVYGSSNINIASGTNSPVTLVHALSSTKVFFACGGSTVASSFMNILTFTPGVGVSLGTYLTGAPNNDASNTRFVGASGNDVSAIVSDKLVVYDASGASPTVKTVVPGQTIRPDADLSDGTHPGMFSEFRVSVLLAANATQYAFGLRSYLTLPSVGSSNAIPVVPPENPKLGFILSAYTVSGVVGASVVRKFELV
jgi:hypothetical protein